MWERGCAYKVLPEYWKEANYAFVQVDNIMAMGRWLVDGVLAGD